MTGSMHRSMAIGPMVFAMATAGFAEPIPPNQTDQSALFLVTAAIRTKESPAIDGQLVDPAAGHKILSYNNPQGGAEEPETYRRNYGLALWHAGFDGACTYAYQHSFGHAWDDFDDNTYRDHNMTYPTVNGVISTVQWEGYREGYDDLRYLATLENWIEQGKRHGGAAGELARKTQLSVYRMQPAGQDLDDLRRQMIAQILALMQALGADGEDAS